MASAGVILDDATVDKLTAGANGHPVPLSNPAGEVVGYFITPDQLARSAEEHRAVVAWLDDLWPPDAIARIAERLKDPARRKYTAEDVLRLVEGR